MGRVEWQGGDGVPDGFCANVFNMLPKLECAVECDPQELWQWGKAKMEIDFGKRFLHRTFPLFGDQSYASLYKPDAYTLQNSGA